MKHFLHLLFIVCICNNVSFAQASISNTTQKIYWSKQQLHFDDFKIIDNDAKPDSSQFAAITFANIKYRYLVHQDSLYLTISNIFDYDHSWMRSSAVGNQSILKHEQGHFDISEIGARTFYQKCATFFFTKNYKEELSTILKQIFISIDRLHIQYDEETNHGVRKRKQLLWNKKIKDTLNALPIINDKKLKLYIHRF